jgi:hypothetical protein
MRGQNQDETAQPTWFRRDFSVSAFRLSINVAKTSAAIARADPTGPFFGRRPFFIKEPEISACAGSDFEAWLGQ